MDATLVRRLNSRSLAGLTCPHPAATQGDHYYFRGIVRQDAHIVFWQSLNGQKPPCPPRGGQGGKIVTIHPAATSVSVDISITTTSLAILDVREIRQGEFPPPTLPSPLCGAKGVLHSLAPGGGEGLTANCRTCYIASLKAAS
jgi:hypothetical protein